MNTDVLPTIAAAIGLEPAAREIDGIDLGNVFDDPDATPDRHLLFFNN